MTLVKRKYKRGIIKFLLATVYLFLFAAQISGRFYSIANFYVYSDNRGGTATAAPVATVAMNPLGTVAGAANYSAIMVSAAMHPSAELKALRSRSPREREVRTPGKKEVRSSSGEKEVRSPAEVMASSLSSKVRQEKSRYPGKPLRPGKAVRLIVYKTTRQDNSHLSLDKRFQGRYPVQATPSDSLLTLLAYAEFKRKCTVCDQAVKSFDRTINSLRGPPTA